jgi:glucose-1-phosphate thymidylyltransferase
MDAVVLAGGYATRLWPITRDRPKMLLPIGGTTVIDRILSALETNSRIETVYVSTNEAFAEEFETHIADEGYGKAQLSVEETTDEDEKFGVVGALAQLVDREGIDDDLFVVAGDNVIGFDVADFLDYFEAAGTPVIAAYDVGSREKAKSYGIVDLDDERVVDFQEKPDEPRSTLASIACYGFPAEDVSFAEYLDGENNPDEPGWYIEWLQDRQAVHAFTFDGTWFDIGTPESYLDTVAWALGDDVEVHPEATVEDSDLGSAVQVMPGAEVSGSTLERTVVFRDATVEDCRVANSLVGDGVVIDGLDIESALMTDLETTDQ